jgi:hypothetical protein
MRAATWMFAGGLSIVLVGCLVGSESVEGTGGGSPSNGDPSSSGSPSSSGDPGSSGSPAEPPECTVDTDCAYRDTDQDVCTKATCRYGKCQQELVKNTPECQCHTETDCAYYVKECSSATCEAHKCIEHVTKAGPLEKQKAGDCKIAKCDGTNKVATTTYAATDLPNDDNECTVDTCDATSQGPKYTNKADGTPCSGGNGICFAGSTTTKSTCLPCKPGVCSGEAGEPANNSGTTAPSLKQFTPFCAYSSNTDVDWYTFYAKDADLSYDVFSFSFWSTAPTLKVCIYVKCGNGQPPGGGCSVKEAGPNGSQGCCWQSAPASLKPSWDLDCPGTGEDSGTAYVSVSAPGGKTCETYAMTGGY